MTMDEPPQHPPGEGVVSSTETLATSNPPSIASSQATTRANSTTDSANAKVAIPRQRSGIAPRYNRRVPRACESCRQRKTKCSGDTPVCRQCRELRATCQYPVGWRERTKKQLEKISEKAQEYETLLKELGAIVETRTADRIKSLLDKHGMDVDSSSNSAQTYSATPQDEIPETANDEPSSPSSVGSLEAIDRVEEDLNRTEHSRATGFMGKNSEITWMQRLQREAEQRSRGQPGTWESHHAPFSDEYTLHSVNYHLDDLDISVPGPVQLYAMPPRQLADKLFEDYLTTVYPFYPIINRPLFRAQYRKFFDSAARPGDKWLAILNMIFAIGAKHAHLTDAPWRGDSQDHLVYLTRARILSMNGDVLFSHPDLQQVQVEGLIAFYLLSSGQINRAWRISALAVRSAITLGINMKNSSPSTSNISKEARYRVWWCLYTFEHMLGIMTGRATCILDGICTSPLPVPFEEDQLQEPAAAELLNDWNLRNERVSKAMASSWIRLMQLNPTDGKESSQADRHRDTSWVRSVPMNYGLCFLFYCDLAMITQEIVNKVYSVDCAMVPWSHIENRIGELRSRIDLWFSTLPEALNFTRIEDEGPDLLRCKLSLAFHYYSARVTLGRPCLCRRDARQKSLSQKSTFSHEMAILTLESASRLLDLIPDEPNAIQLYQISPWWCILHYLMQAATVLLLELSFGSVHIPEDEKNFIQLAKKAIRWLHAMSPHSIASRRAWQLCDVSLRRLAVGMKFDVSDIPSGTYGAESQVPQGIHSAMEVEQSDPPVTGGDFRHPHLESAQPGNNGSQPMAEGGQTILHNYPDLATSDLMSSLTTDANMTDLFFPYDPICSEFIRSFFPHSGEEEAWEQQP